jgi:crcB protein
MRYLTSVLAVKLLGRGFPAGTLIVNILGCFLAGVLIGLLDRHSVAPDANLRLMLIAGFCGGYTTFSAFSVENLGMLQSGNYVMALANIFVSVIIGLAGVWLGTLITR